MATQQLQIECDRKDLMIADLRTQLSELGKYRELVTSLRAQLNVAQQRAGLRSQEGERKLADLQERCMSATAAAERYQAQLQRVEDERLQQAYQLQRRIDELEHVCAQQRRELEHKDRDVVALSRDLQAQTDVLRQQQRNMGDVEHELQQRIRLLSEEKASLGIERGDLQDRLSAERARVDQLRVELQALDGKLTSAQREREAINRLRLESEEKCEVLSQQVAELQDLCGQLEASAASVDQLRRDSSALRVAQADLRATQLRVQELESEVDGERASRRVLEDELRRMDERLQKSEAISRELRSLTSPRSELSEKRRQVQVLQAELDAMRASLRESEDNESQAKRAAQQIEGKLNFTVNEMAVAFAAIGRAVDSQLKGSNSVVLDVQTLVPASNLLHGGLTACAARVRELLEHFVAMRGDLEGADSRSRAAESSMHARELEHSDVLRELSECKTRIAQQSVEFSALQRECATKDGHIGELQRDLASMVDHERSHLSFVGAVCRQLRLPEMIAQGAADATARLQSSMLGRSPVAERSMAALDRSTGGAAAALSWDRVQAELGDAASRVVAEWESLSAETVRLSEKLAHRDRQLEDLQQQLTAAWQRASETERAATQQLLSEREQHDSIRETLLSEAQETRDRLESELRDVREALAAHEVSVRRLQGMTDVLSSERAEALARQSQAHGALRLVVRAVRPLLLRVKELRDQKSVLNRLQRSYERMYADTASLYSALKGQALPAMTLEGARVRQRVTLRVAAIAAWCGQRMLRTVRNRKRFMGVQAVGARGIDLRLLDASEVGDSGDLPRVDGQNEADAFWMVVRHFDPTAEFATETLYSRSFIEAVSRGRRDFLWRHRRQSTYVSPEALIAAVCRDVLGFSRRLREEEEAVLTMRRLMAEKDDRMSSMARTTESAQNALSQAQENIRMLEQRMLQSQQQLAAMVAPDRFEQARGELDRLAAEVELLKEERARLNSEIGSARAALAQLENDKQVLSERVAALDADRGQVARQLRAKDDELADLRQMMQRRASEAQSVDDERRTVLEKLRDAQRTSDNATHERALLQQRVLQLETEISSKSKAAEGLEAQVLQLERQRQVALDTQQRLEATLSQRERQLQDANDLVQALTQRVQDARLRNEELTRKWAVGRQQLLALKSELVDNVVREEQETRGRTEWARTQLHLVDGTAGAEQRSPRHASDVYNRSFVPQVHVGTGAHAYVPGAGAGAGAGAAGVGATGAHGRGGLAGAHYGAGTRL